MSVMRGTYTDKRRSREVTFTVLDTSEPYIGAVYISPTDRPDVSCEIAGTIGTRCTRDDLREWAQAILDALDGPKFCPQCGGMGSHGLVHLRHGNGGGHNEPCPAGAR